MTVDTAVWYLYGGRVITFLIKLGGELKDVSWTIFNTVATSLAAVFQDIDHPSGNLDVIRIEWNSPVRHDLSPQP